MGIILIWIFLLQVFCLSTTKSDNLSIEKVGDRVEFGEGPHWDEDTQSLYFVDISNATINKYTPSTKNHTSALIGGHVSFIIPLEGSKDKFVVGRGNQIVQVTWDGVSETIDEMEKIAEVPTTDETILNTLNDAKADETGRLWFGTISRDIATKQFSSNKAALYSLGEHKSVIKQVDNVTISNGIAWNPELQKMYYIDSPERKIYQFDYDVENGTISNQETIFTLDKHNIEGGPDGQTIDSDGNLWIAIMTGGRIIKIDPREPETLLQTIEFPVQNPTSVAFGGENFDELYFTSASFRLNSLEFKPEDGNGYVYVIKGLGVQGSPGVKVKL